MVWFSQGLGSPPGAAAHGKLVLPPPWGVCLLCATPMRPGPVLASCICSNTAPRAWAFQEQYIAALVAVQPRQLSNTRRFRCPAVLLLPLCHVVRGKTWMQGAFSQHSVSSPESSEALKTFPQSQQPQASWAQAHTTQLTAARDGSCLSAATRKSSTDAADAAGGCRNSCIE